MILGRCGREVAQGLQQRMPMMRILRRRRAGGASCAEFIRQRPTG